jgi:hypothetical protein
MTGTARKRSGKERVRKGKGQERKATTEQSGQDCQVRTARIGQLEKNNHDGQENQDIHW